MNNFFEKRCFLLFVSVMMVGLPLCAMEPKKAESEELAERPKRGRNEDKLSIEPQRRSVDDRAGGKVHKASRKETAEEAPKAACEKDEWWTADDLLAIFGAEGDKIQPVTYELVSQEALAWDGEDLQALFAEEALVPEANVSSDSEKKSVAEADDKAEKPKPLWRRLPFSDTAEGYVTFAKRNPRLAMQAVTAIVATKLIEMATDAAAAGSGDPGLVIQQMQKKAEGRAKLVERVVRVSCNGVSKLVKYLETLSDDSDDSND